MPDLLKDGIHTLTMGGKKQKKNEIVIVNIFYKKHQRNEYFRKYIRKSLCYKHNYFFKLFKRFCVYIILICSYFIIYPLQFYK